MTRFPAWSGRRFGQWARDAELRRAVGKIFPSLPPVEISRIVLRKATSTLALDDTGRAVAKSLGSVGQEVLAMTGPARQQREVMSQLVAFLRVSRCLYVVEILSV